MKKLETQTTIWW